MSISRKNDVSQAAPKREAIIGKIRALMAKTVENGATEAEAKAASAKIDELMSAYAIEVTETESDGDAKRPRRRGAASAEWSPHDRIVLEAERQRLTGYSRAWWYQLELKGKVPARIRLGDRKVGWKLSELREWLEERAALRDAGGRDARPAA